MQLLPPHELDKIAMVKVIYLSKYSSNDFNVSNDTD